MRQVTENFINYFDFFRGRIGDYIMLSFVRLPVAFIAVVFFTINYFEGLGMFLETYEKFNLLSTPEKLDLISIGINNWLVIGAALFFTRALVSLVNFNTYQYQQKYLLTTKKGLDV